MATAVAARSGFAAAGVGAYRLPAEASWLILLLIIGAMAAAWREGRFSQGAAVAVSLAAGLCVGIVIVCGLEIAAVIVVVMNTPGFGSF